MKLPVRIEKNPPIAEQGVQNGVFLQRRWKWKGLRCKCPAISCSVGWLFTRLAMKEIASAMRS